MPKYHYALAALRKNVGDNIWFVVEGEDSRLAWAEGRRQINAGLTVDLVDGETLQPTGSKVTLSRDQHKVVAGKRVDSAMNARDRLPDFIRKLCAALDVEQVQEFIPAEVTKDFDLTEVFDSALRAENEALAASHAAQGSAA